MAGITESSLLLFVATFVVVVFRLVRAHHAFNLGLGCLDVLGHRSVVSAWSIAFWTGEPTEVPVTDLLAGAAKSAYAIFAKGFLRKGQMADLKGAVDRDGEAVTGELVTQATAMPGTNAIRIYQSRAVCRVCVPACLYRLSKPFLSDAEISTFFGDSV